MSETLLQLLVFEHATGDVTVQMETGGLDVFEQGYLSRHCAGVCRHYTRPQNNVREAIDAAVAEQFGKPEPPYIIESDRGGGWFVWSDHSKQDVPLNMGALSALQQVSHLPVVDAAESSPVSTWTKVFPPEDKDYLTYALQGNESNLTFLRKLQTETAVTIWRLTVTR